MTTDVPAVVEHLGEDFLAQVYGRTYRHFPGEPGRFGDLLGGNQRFLNGCCGPDLHVRLERSRVEWSLGAVLDRCCPLRRARMGHGVIDAAEPWG